MTYLFNTQSLTSSLNLLTNNDSFFLQIIILDDKYTYDWDDIKLAMKLLDLLDILKILNFSQLEDQIAKDMGASGGFQRVILRLSLFVMFKVANASSDDRIITEKLINKAFSNIKRIETILSYKELSKSTEATPSLPTRIGYVLYHLIHMLWYFLLRKKNNNTLNFLLVIVIKIQIFFLFVLFLFL